MGIGDTVATFHDWGKAAWSRLALYIIHSFSGIYFKMSHNNHVLMCLTLEDFDLSISFYDLSMNAHVYSGYITAIMHIIRTQILKYDYYSCSVTHASPLLGFPVF